MAEQIELFNVDGAKYEQFVDKFKPKKTTDDCYTPANIFECIADWVASEYGVNKENFVRPFWPGGDYEKFDYSTDCIVVDNPPFSIKTQIVNFYMEHGIKFFIFCPALTLFAGNRLDVSYIACGANITYENGATVPTSFATNLDTCLVRSAPDLLQQIEAINERNEKKKKRTVPKYDYPTNVVTAAMCQYFSHHATEYKLNASDAYFIRALDAQRAAGKAVFGGGFLISEKAAAEKAAAEKAAAEKAAAEKWQLSNKEKAIIACLDRHEIPNEQTLSRVPAEQIPGQTDLFGG